MPHLKQNKIPFQDVSSLLRKYNICTGQQLSDVIYMSPFTARSRMKTPSDFSLTELRLIHRNGHVPLDELCEAIRADL